MASDREVTEPETEPPWIAGRTLGTDTGPVFAMGMARSGTTLLRSVLSLHGRIHIADEAHYFRPANAVQLDGLSANDRFAALWMASEVEIGKREYRATREGVRERFLDGAVHGHREYFEAVVREDAALAGKPRWGAKVPLSYQPLETLLEWFPDASVIWVVRDPRAVVTLRLRRKSGRGKTPAQIARGWERNSHDYARRFHKDARFLFVRYEDLVADWPASAAKMCAFLREETDERMLNPEVSDLRVNTSYRETAAERTTAIVSDRNETWKRVLSSDDVWNVERAARKGMRHYGYAPVPRPSYDRWYRKAKGRARRLWARSSGGRRDR